MTQALLTTALLLVAHSAVGTACNGVPEIDWSEVENLARSFVSKPAPETAEALAAALPSADTIVLPPRSASLREALEKSRAITLDAVDDSTAWAVQLGLRFLRLGDSMFEPKLTAKISGLATTAPRFFLRQLARFSEENPCVVDLVGVVAFFGPSENLEARADPSREAVAQRIEALASVGDDDLQEIRSWCLELLEVLRNRRGDAPRVLRRMAFDPSPFRDRRLRNPFVIAEATVGLDGKVMSVKILRGQDPDLNEAVAKALCQWIFEPKLEEGQPVEFTYVETLWLHPR